ncbi:hypothetical protein DIPPA_28710 [Diplonema papillatum]|nr:hypothetical protein DIPPA_28710 [Diplonema papillatum]
MRSQFLARWRKRSDELSPHEGDPCHVELLGEMLRDLRISGADDLLFHLKTGCPMSGVVGYGGLYTPGPPGAPEMTEEELVRRQGDVLARSVRAIRSDSKDNRLAIWRSVQKEVAAGYMVAVRPPANAVYLRRFLIRQVKFDDEGSRIQERTCDDGRMALVNKSVHMSMPVKLDTTDVYVEVWLSDDPAATFRYVLFTDVCLFGLGAVLATVVDGFPTAVEYFAHPVPPAGSELQIHHLEFAAVSVAFSLWFNDRFDFTVSVWVDNSIVLGSLIQGRTKAKELLLPVHAFWERLARSRGDAWFERVPGEDNLSDLPSRLNHAWADIPFKGLRPKRRDVEQRIVDEAIADVLGGSLSGLVGSSASPEP